jgi:hypothetical protein
MLKDLKFRHKTNVYKKSVLYGSGIQTGVRVHPRVSEDMSGVREIKKKKVKVKEAL